MMIRSRTGSGSGNRVNRGGSWNNEPANVRCANRNNDAPGDSNDNLGFRLGKTKDRRNTRPSRRPGQSHLSFRSGLRHSAPVRGIENAAAAGGW